MTISILGEDRDASGTNRTLGDSAPLMLEHLVRRYARHLEEKEEALRALFGASGDAVPGRIRPSPIDRGHRGRVKCVIHGLEHGSEQGLFGYDPIRGKAPFRETNWILPEFGRRIAAEVFRHAVENRAEYPVDGFEMQLVHGGDSAHVVLQVKRSRKNSYGTFAAALYRSVPGLCGVAVPSQGIEVGDRFLAHRIGGAVVYGHYGSFFQSNVALTSCLVETVKDFAGASPQAIVDLYCGVGLHSVVTAPPGAAVTGADSSRAGIESARRNAAERKPGSFDYRCTTVERFVRDCEFRSPDLVIVNPPRAGCPQEVIRRVAAWEPLRVIAVSCFPATHADDLATWKDCGYRTLSMRAFDMFPFTEFVETVTLLGRR